VSKPKLLNTDRQQLLPWLLTGSALLVACWFLLQLVSLWLAPPAGDYPSLPPRQPVAQVDSIDGGWFGENTMVASVSNQTQQQLPKARLDAQLLGVLLIGDNAVANIAHGKKRDGVYRVGDKLSGNITVEAIEARRVVIREQGQLRQIDLLALGSGKSSTASSAQTQRANRNSRGTAASSTMAMPAGFATVTLPNGQIGLQMSADTLTRLSKYGLQAGEVVTDVDGMNVTDLMADRAKLTSLMMMDSVEVTVFRDGRSRSVSVQPAAVASSFYAAQ
jgi:general secretion pathway protein C